MESVYPAVPTASDSKHAYGLCDITHGITQPIVCGGSYSPSEPVVVQVANLSPVSFFREMPKEQVDLIASVIPQPYGMTPWNHPVQAEVVHFRNGQFPFSVLNFDPQTSGVIDAIQNTLLPNDPHQVVAELHSMNIYRGRGGFELRDVPAGNETVGTLVVCLPCKFTSWNPNDFVVESQGVNNHFRWASAISNAQNSKDLQWVAFFGDCSYSLHDITSGARVTLIYLLRRGADAPPDIFSYKPPTATSIGNLLKEALKDEHFLRQGGTLAFPCFQVYNKELCFKKEIATFNAKSLSKLKGVDLAVALGAHMLGLNATMHPFLIESVGGKMWSLKHFPTRSKIGKKQSEDTVINNFPYDPTFINKHVLWTQSPPQFGYGKSPKILKTGEDIAPVPKNTAVVFFSAVTFTRSGNYLQTEHTEADFCLFASIDVEIPPYGTPERNNAIQGRPEVVQASTSPKLKSLASTLAKKTQSPSAQNSMKAQQKSQPRAKGYSDEDSETFDNEVDSYEEEYIRSMPKQLVKKVVRRESDSNEATDSLTDEEVDDFAHTWTAEDDQDYKPVRVQKQKKEPVQRSTYKNTKPKKNFDSDEDEEFYSPKKKLKGLPGKEFK